MGWIRCWPGHLLLRVLVLGFLIPALSLSLLLEGHAQDIVILKSADIAAYNKATLTFTKQLPPSTTISEFNLEGNMAEGRKIARKLRASNAKLILAIGLKAAKLKSNPFGWFVQVFVNNQLLFHYVLSLFKQCLPEKSLRFLAKN